MRTILLALLGGTLIISPARAADNCEIEDWKYTHTPIINMLQIDGATTCAEGKIRMRVYAGEGDDRKFIGVASPYIRGNIFQAVLYQIAEPSGLSIRYIIEPEK